MYNNYNQIDKAKHFDFNVGTVNYMAKLMVWSPHVMKVFPHVMRIHSKVWLDGDSSDPQMT